MDQDKVSVEAKKPSWFNHFHPNPTGSMAAGRLGAEFTSLDQVEAWVNGYGDLGEWQLNIWLDRGDGDEISQRLARAWLEQTRERRANERLERELGIAQRAADSAEKSARWTMYAACIAAVGTAITAGVAVCGMFQQPAPGDVKASKAEAHDANTRKDIQGLRMSRELSTSPPVK
ncbi:hypothetical protein ABN448_21960 [Delftia acidovorans]|uniref:hypothetical protein n=1 Tax=Delftia acidovorans TaxID=80866 RepID=UPI0032DEE1B7